MKGLPPTVTSIGGRDRGVRSVGGLIDLQVAAPKEMGGQGDKTNREELFAAGYAACSYGAVKRIEKLRWASRRSKRASVSVNDCGSGFMLAAALHVTLPGANAEAAKDVVRRAHTVCPYSNAARNNIHVKLRVRLPTETNTTCQPNIRNQT